MVEIPKDCVLQWAGHAGYMTERFSGLLARQVLVDVTLVCDEQKLRVHKLVLASNSIYFEEILQQDLGQEPIIFLKDLHFEILKAMIEFMYCGETTISHQHLSSLLAAAKIFKVKELISVIDPIIDAKKIMNNYGNCPKQQKEDCNLKAADNSQLTENDYVRVRCDKLSMDENTLVCADSNNDISLSNNQSLENDMIDSIDNDSEHTLYEESDAIDATSETDTSSFSVSDVNISKQSDSNSSTVSTIYSKANEVQTRCTPSNINETYCNSHDLKPILYEQYCDLTDVSERDQTSPTTPLSQSCLSQVENDFEPHSGESSTDVPSKVGKCVKVYTHKRRKSIDEVRSKLVHTRNLVPTPPPSTDSIDLLDEPSANDVPVTMLTSLDMESAEYILSLSAESIQSIVGGTISDQHTVIGYKELINENSERDKERSKSTSDVDYAKPVLRRSMRLNQQESDESNTASNNLSLGSSTTNEKLLKKNNISNGTESYTKAKRKGKEDRKVPDQNIVDSVLQPSNKRSHKKRSNSKLIVKKSNKSACTVTSNKEKEENSKSRATNNKLKTENTEKWVSDRTAVSYVKSDTIGGINRILWGDMADAFDGQENEINVLAYPSNTEIPFAVGLLPLRTALEKMQATPDYQPRKTRSSVAPMKQDASNNLKRKINCMPSDVAVPKKQNGSNESPKTTVCHIEIKTTPSQDIKNRRSRFLSDSIVRLSTTNVANRQ